VHTQDGHLIQKCLDGDSAAFGFLVDKYRQSVYALAYSRLGNFHDAEDVTQEAFITAYEKLNALKRWDSFYAWLYSITVNLCKMWRRSRSNRPDREYLEDQDEAVLDAPSIEAYQAEWTRQAGAAHEQVHQALAALPETYREVLTLYYLGGMSSQEIAQFLRTSPTAINMRLSRARAQLKEEILTMMSATFAPYKLQPSFTFRIVEQIKQTKIQTGIQKTALPWGLSIATGLTALLLILSVPFTPIFPIGRLNGSALPAETQVAEKGEIPVDVIKITEITILSSETGKVDFGQKPKPEPLNAFAPPGQEGKWARKADMPTARFFFNTAVVNGVIYAIGGWDGSKALATVEAYEPASNRWMRKADMLTARTSTQYAVVDEIIYVLSGSETVDATREVEAYNPATDTWTRKADIPTPRGNGSASVVDGKIYVIGGALPGQPLATVEMYDPATDTWTKKADMPDARLNHDAVVVNGKIYVFGGGNEKITLSPALYDPVTDTWTRLADMSRGKGEQRAVLLNGKVYVLGGLGLSEDRSSFPPLSTVEIYDLATDTWTFGVDLPTPNWGFGASLVDGKIYIFGGGGENDQAHAGVYEFDPSPPASPTSVTPAGKFATLWGKLKGTIR